MMDKKKKFSALAVTSFLIFLNGINYTLPNSFLPREGHKKKTTNTQLGIIIGMFDIVMVVFSPLIGRFLPSVGPKFVLITGSLLQGLFCVLFGLTVNLPDGASFLAMSIISSLLQGLGSAMVYIASMTFIPILFPSHITAVNGFLETILVTGMTMGPIVGALFYTIGGYSLPFIVIGVTTMVFSILILPVIPSVADNEDESKFEIQSYKALLHQSNIIVLSYTLFITALVVHFIYLPLPIHLTEYFNTSVLHIGLVFLALDGTYCLGSFLIGWICIPERANILSVVGLVLITTAYILIGPSPMLKWIQDLDKLLWVTIVCLTAIGLGCSLAVVPVYESMLNSAIDSGLPHNMSTYAMISALFSSIYGLGAFAGPFLAGLILDTVGYQWSTTIMAFLAATGLLARGIHWLRSWTSK